MILEAISWGVLALLVMLPIVLEIIFHDPDKHRYWDEWEKKYGYRNFNRRH